MTLDTLIIIGGAFVAILPFLGFPSSWDTALLFLAGIFIIGLGITLRRRTNSREPGTKNSNMFVENSPIQKGEHDPY